MRGKSGRAIDAVSAEIDKREDYAADLDQALSVADIGQYNIRYSLIVGLFLMSAVIEPIGYSYVLPAAACELNMSSAQRGFIASVPYIGMFLTSFPLGYLVDTQGRKKSLVYSALVCGFFGILSAFMPDLITFTICKFLSSLCIGCASSAPFTFIGEVVPAKYKDLILSVSNSLQISGTVLVPLIAWGILPLSFRVDFGLYEFSSWRLLTILYSSFFVISALLLSFGPESPKFLVSQGKHDEALKVLQTIYAANKRKHPEDYPIKFLKSSNQAGTKSQSFLESIKAQSVPLLKAPYLKWLSLNGFLLFGVFTTLNGLYVWVPDILNRVLTEDGNGRTACQVINQRLNETTEGTEQCVDTIDNATFLINSVANLCCAILAIIISPTVSLIGKKALIIIIFFLIGTFCMLINFITIDMLFAVFLSSIPLMGLSVGPINAFALDIFPTYLRGMAISLSMMVGRIGSIFGANATGLLLDTACEATFYTFGGLLILCGLLTFLLPKSKPPQSSGPFVENELIRQFTKL